MKIGRELMDSSEHLEFPTALSTEKNNRITAGRHTNVFIEINWIMVNTVG